MIAWSAVITFIVYLFKKKFGSKVPKNLNMSVQTTQPTQLTKSNQIEQINDAQPAGMSGIKDQVQSKAELIQEQVQVPVHVDMVVQDYSKEIENIQ
jgi:putative N-acetylmannosamine-6-phosphate epimerase